MANDYFMFRQFTVRQGKAAFKVTTDSVLLGAWADIETADCILDIGTGSGLLALMAAQRTNALITAIEPDEGSFEQASANFSSSPWSDRLTLKNITLQDFATTADGRFGAIVCNPPYFTDSLLNPDKRKAAARHNAWLPPSDLVRLSGVLLSETGTLNVVIPASEGDALLRMAESAGLYCHRMLKVSPLPAVPPKRLLLTLGRGPADTEEKTLVVETGVRHQYSDEYLSLTRDFYLDR